MLQIISIRMFLIYGLYGFDENFGDFGGILEHNGLKTGQNRIRKNIFFIPAPVGI